MRRTLALLAFVGALTLLAAPAAVAAPDAPAAPPPVPAATPDLAPPAGVGAVPASPPPSPPAPIAQPAAPPAPVSLEERRVIRPAVAADVPAARRPGPVAPWTSGPCVAPCPVPTPCGTLDETCLDPLRRPDPVRCFPTAYWGLSPSFMPNVGVTLEIGGVYRRKTTATWSWEAALTWQPIDDETFVDDGKPAAGDWFQFQGGVKWISAPTSRRHWAGRFGGVWCWSGDEPNLVESKGHYFGAYVGVGYEADLSSVLTMGPEIRGLLLVHESGRVEVIPQFVWHVLWNF